MKAATKRRVNDALQRAVNSVPDLTLKRVRQGVWAADQGTVRWLVDACYEPGYGDGVFRVGWGVLAPGAAEIVGLEEPGNAGSHFATVGGDLGGLALRKRRMGAVEAAEQWKDAVRGSPLLTRRVDGIIATIRRKAAG